MHLGCMQTLVPCIAPKHTCFGICCSWNYFIVVRLQADKVTRLMGCLCYTKRLASSPYADLLAESQWSAIAQEFVRQCCGLMGLVSSARRAVAMV